MEPRWRARDMGIRTAEAKHRIRPDRGPAPDRQSSRLAARAQIFPDWDSLRSIHQTKMALIALTAWRGPVDPKTARREPKPTWRQTQIHANFLEEPPIAVLSLFKRLAAFALSQTAFASCRSQGKHIRRRFCSSQLTRLTFLTKAAIWDNFPFSQENSQNRGVSLIRLVFTGRRFCRVGLSAQFGL
jgi:hypothetical protein